MTSNTEITSAGHNTNTTATIISGRPRILALHGGGQTARGLELMRGMQDLTTALPEFDFVFASTPEENNVWIKDPPGGKGAKEPNNDPNWADLTISYLDNMVASEGPFYALLGYSQGSGMVLILNIELKSSKQLLAGQVSSNDIEKMSSIDLKLIGWAAQLGPIGAL